MTASHESHSHHKGAATDKDANWYKRRSRYGLIAFIVLIAAFCEIYSQKFNQNSQSQNQFQNPSSTMPVFAQPTAPPTKADAIPTSPVPNDN